MADLKTTEEDPVSDVSLLDMVRLALAGGGNARATIAQIGDAIGSVGSSGSGLTFTSDTGSTADSDPGNGLFKWNNAAQGSATVLYFDNLTADGVSTTTFFTSFGQAGFLRIQQASDSTRWQLWKIVSVVAGSGYYKFTVVLQQQSGSIVDNELCFCTFDATAGSASSGRGHPCGRLSVLTGDPIPNADQVGASTLYYVPYNGNAITLWDGAAWQTVVMSAQVSLALSGLTSGKPYDVFGVLSAGALALELLVWANDVARATSVTLQDGRYCKTGDKTRLYLGTIYTTGTTTTEDSAKNRLVWNYYNRVRRDLRAVDTTDNWVYSTATYRQANNSSANQVVAMVGVAEDPLQLSAYALTFSTVTSAVFTGIGVNSTTVNSAQIKLPGNCVASTVNGSPASHLTYFTPGRNVFAWLEKGVGSGTQTFYGDAGAPADYQTGLVGYVIG